MILISKTEAEYIRSHFPNAYITLINRQKKSRRKKYYVEESHKVMQYLMKNRKMKGMK